MHSDIRITGLVQGVSFRQNCLKKAVSLGLCGWVKNNPDGSVSVAAEGEEKNLNLFIDWCRSGPPYTRINQVVVNLGGINKFTGFKIVFNSGQ